MPEGVHPDARRDGQVQGVYGVALLDANRGAQGGEVRRQTAALIAKDQAERHAYLHFRQGDGSLQHEQAEISAGIRFQVAFHAVKEANRRENSAPMLARITRGS